MWSLPVATTPEIDDLTCICHIIILAAWTPTADDNYDPTCECFHIDGAIASNLEAEVAVGGRNATPPQVELPGARDEAQFLGAAQGAQLEQIQELQAKLDEE
jgi:hypothetical protein